MTFVVVVLIAAIAALVSLILQLQDEVRAKDQILDAQTKIHNATVARMRKMREELHQTAVEVSDV